MGLRTTPNPPYWDANVTTSATTIGSDDYSNFTVADQAYYIIITLKSAAGDLVISTTNTGETGEGVILEDGAGGIRNWGTHASPGTVIRVTGAEDDVFHVTTFYNKL